MLRLRLLGFSLLLLVWANNCGSTESHPQPAVTPTVTPTATPAATPATGELPANVTLAGVRSSAYGIQPFPEPAGWEKAMDTMAGYFPGATPMGIWIVGPLDGSVAGCRLEFPRPDDGVDYGPRITFSSADEHERYLDHFDASGIRVFLQVEPGFAEVGTLIDLVLSRYRQHPSVIGFGIDVEWFENAQTGGANAKATDALVATWEAKVKAHDPRYRLFVKHFDRNDLPPSHRGDVIFVDDSQQFGSYASFLQEFKEWADFFYPSPVIYQIGYRADRPWWSALPAPIPQTMGRDLCRQTRQDCGIAWVDFTLREVLPSE